MKQPYPRVFTSDQLVIKRTLYSSTTSSVPPHDNHKLDKDRHFKQLFRGGKTPPGSTNHPSTFSTPCARYSERSFRAKGLNASLGLPANLPLKIPKCASIHPTLFYQTFNRHSRALYLAKKAHNIPVPCPPLIFDLNGSFIDAGKWWPRGQVYFKAEHKLPEHKATQETKIKGTKMPSSCKDIRTLVPTTFQSS